MGGGIPMARRESPLALFLRSVGIELPETQPAQAPEFDLSQFLQNVQTSGANLANQSWRMFTHPDEVAKPLLDLVGGGMANLVPEGWRTPAIEPSRQAAAALPGALAQSAYESADVDRIMQALYEDPVGLLSNLEGMGPAMIGMAGVRKGALAPWKRVPRDVATQAFLNKGNLGTAADLVDTTGLSGKALDDALAKGRGLYLALKEQADPRMFDVDQQRRMIEAGIPNADWYLRSKQGIDTYMGGDPLVPKLLSATSSNNNPFNNTDLMLGVYASHGLGHPLDNVLDYAALPNNQAMVRKILAGKAQPFGHRKTNNFALNLAGDYRPVTADSWTGNRGFGFSVRDDNARVLNMQGKEVEGAYVPYLESSQAGGSRTKLAQANKLANASQTDLAEEVIAALSGEFGLDPAAAQAAQWFGVKQALSDLTAPHLGLPFDEQIGARFAEWGIPAKALGQRFSPDELTEILRQIDLRKAAPAGTRSHFGLKQGLVDRYGNPVTR